METADNETPFLAAVRLAGSQEKLGAYVGKRQSSVTYWRKTGIPAHHAVEIEKASGGKIPRWVMRPDLWDAPPAKKGKSDV